jgi:hypothetical protein
VATFERKPRFSRLWFKIASGNLGPLMGANQGLRAFGKPVVCNEDAKTGAAGAKATAAGASWG